MVVNFMQEIIKFDLTILSLDMATINRESSGLLRFSFVSFPRRFTVTIDRLLVSDEAIRVLPSKPKP